MTQEMPSAIVRQWLILSMLPSPPRKIDTASIQERLRARGDRVHRRTIQRDLVQLSAIFPIVADERNKPYGWRWSTAAARPELVLAAGVRAAAPDLVVRLRVLDGVEGVAGSHAVDLVGGRDARIDGDAVTCRVSDDHLTRRALLGLADALEVISPPALRSDLAALARRALALYEGRSRYS